MAFVVLTSFFLWGWFVRLPRKRVILGGVVFGILWAYFLGVLLTSMGRDLRHAVVVLPGEARFEPFDHATVHFSLREGEEVFLRRREDRWVKVQRRDGKVGWVTAEAVEKVILPRGEKL
ncbi:MAG: SH3 domain-containing protein [Elusimicrobia bacterium]|nr:SH3 domain-containing protein [Elusimicrobiota bacterium]